MASSEVALPPRAPVLGKFENVSIVASRLKALKVTQLPVEYVFPDSLVNAGSSVTNDARNSGLCGLPVVDLAGLTSGDPALREELLRQIRDAATEWGFFHVVNHGIPDHVIKALDDQTRAFFELPVDVRQRGQDPSEVSHGYKGAVHQTNDKLMWLEYLAQIYRPTPAVEDLANKIWPDGNPAFCKAVHDFCGSAERLAQVLMGTLAQSLGLPASDFGHLDQPAACRTAFRLHHYPPCPDPSRTMGTAPHTDSGFLTVLKQDAVGGLQVKHCDGAFVDVAPLDGALVVNVGDTLQALSNGVFRSAQHQVRVNEKFSRFSMMYFIYAGDDMVIEAPSKLVDDTQPLVYAPFTGGQFRANFLKLARSRQFVKEGQWLEFALLKKPEEDLPEHVALGPI